MRKGTTVNNKLLAIWRKVKFNRNKSIAQYTYACDKVQLDKNAYGVFQIAKCEFIADAFSDKPDPMLEAILKKYLIFISKEKCIGDE